MEETKKEEIKEEAVAPTTAKKERKPRKKKEETVKSEAGAEEPKKEETKSKKKKKKQALVLRGKRKESIARATIRAGKGNVRINHMKLEAYYSNKYIRDIVRQPLSYLGPETLSIDISIDVIGGGMMGQAQAARTAIANALVEYFPDQNLKEKFLSIDRSLLIEDVRRVEPKKFKGPKARARFQKSYR
ncbi:30S ribosomal protein S9 [Candidatus Micrarchaeota archaeon]|nr:30S ribosomal protein S9 [Candidatus Micrarchaeota archaeon]